MARIAVGDVQGCLPELRQLLKQADFRSDRDEVWFVGDLVNRGPDSLGTLRFVRALGDNARVVLGNHDLHLLAVAFGGSRKLRADDTLDDILNAADRESLMEWLVSRPLAVREGSDLMVHAGIVPQWTVEEVMTLSAEVEQALRTDPVKLFESMYGNRPDLWSPALEGSDRLRFVINVLTRLRYCRADGRIDLKMKGAPGSQESGWMPWFAAPDRRTSSARVITGHWSTLGFVDRPDLLSLDTGCVWGGALTAAALDSNARWSLPCGGYQRVKMSAQSDG
jgi:bis(5'-nucleosyl)-tetraphosphatase (symmetrical)